MPSQIKDDQYQWTISFNGQTQTFEQYNFPENILLNTPNGTDLTASIILEVKNSGYFVPNAFTPNQDGIDDFFTIYGSDEIT